MFAQFCCREVPATAPHAVPRAGMTNLYSSSSLSLHSLCLVVADIGNLFSCWPQIGPENLSTPERVFTSHANAICHPWSIVSSLEILLTWKGLPNELFVNWTLKWSVKIVNSDTSLVILESSWVRKRIGNPADQSAPIHPCFIVVCILSYWLEIGPCDFRTSGPRTSSYYR